MKRFFFLLFLVTFFFLYRSNARLIPLNTPIPTTSVVEIAPTPKIYKPIETYLQPKVKPASSYTILFVGDSMTAALGDSFELLRGYLSGYYPGKEFGLFNYGFGSTNILSVEERFDNESLYLGKTIPPIFGRYSDVIVIESFAYNPLSGLGLEQGIITQNETLDRLVARIVEAKPETLIVFLATIAPSKPNFGKGVTDYSVEERIQQASERITYLENHINYAQKHNIPIINVYEKSLDKNGNALLKYISPESYIHPSPEGVRFISKTIADFFHQNNILPK